LLIAFPGATREAGAVDPRVHRALASARRQGFAAATHLEWSQGHALWYPTSGNPLGSGALVQDGRRFAAYVGSVHWQGLTRTALLRRVLAGFDAPASMPLRDFSGAFAMLFCDGDQVWLFHDAVGIQKVYATADRFVLSTSLLVCRSTLASPRVNRLRAQEYVLLGSTHALDTAIDGVRVLDPTQALELRSGTTRTLHPAEDWRCAPRFRTMPEAVDTLAAMIAADFDSMARAFGPKIGMALSGGFDSRLLLAALDHQGVVPTLYVYGSASDSDVRVAVAKAADLGLAIECVDKASANAELAPLDRERLRDSLTFFDALPVDGAFDRGMDRATRLHQVRDGTLNLNGGGGEILRNFFYLPDRDFTAADLVDTFYSNWLPRAIPGEDERQALKQALEQVILECLGFDAGTARARVRRLSRSDIELVYSLFRLRFWMGRNNTIAARYGAFLTPLAQPRLVELAAAVPLQSKTDGDLEAAIIRALSPRVARGPSNYGFDFALGPTVHHRWRIRATLWRPVALRRRSAALRRSIGRNPTPQMPAEWTEAYPSGAVDWIDSRFLTDRAQLNRLKTLQAVLDDVLSL
jgi:asparagine synthase (glutamine-hydrolysing)